MIYVNKVRKYIYQQNMILDDAVENAVTECIKEGILEDFMRENRAEVIAMSIFEFNEEREMKLIREEEYQSGRVEGIKEGELRILFNLYKEKIITLDTALQKISMNEEEFFSKIKEYQIK